MSHTTHMIIDLLLGIPGSLGMTYAAWAHYRNPGSSSDD